MIAVFPANDPDLPTIDPILVVAPSTHRTSSWSALWTGSPQRVDHNGHRTLRQNDSLKRQATAPERHLGVAPPVVRRLRAQPAAGSAARPVQASVQRNRATPGEGTSSGASATKGGIMRHRTLLFGLPVLLTIPAAHLGTARAGARPVEFSDARLKVEIDATDADAGLQTFLDGEAWNEVHSARLARLRVRDTFCWTCFPSASPLPPPPPPPRAPALFGGFTGTTGLSDFPPSYISSVRPWPSLGGPPRSAGRASVGSPGSRASRFPACKGYLTHTGSADSSRV